MKMVESVQKRLIRIATANKMQISFTLEKGTIDAVFISRRLQEEYHADVAYLT